MDASRAPSAPRAASSDKILTRLDFQLLSDAVAEKMQVVVVTEPATYAASKGQPKAGGLLDLRMGPLHRAIVCPTCACTDCDGHYGIIRLAAWVLRLPYVGVAVQLARTHCWACGRPKFCVDAADAAAACAAAGVPPAACVVDGWRGGAAARAADAKTSWVNVSARARAARGAERLRLISEACKTRRTCPWTAEAVRARGRGEAPCGVPQPSYRAAQHIFVERVWDAKAIAALAAEPQRVADARAPFSADALHDALAAMSDDAIVALGFPGFRDSDPRWIVTKVQLVPPCRTRQPSSLSAAGGSKHGASAVGGGGGENDQTLALLEVVKANIACADAKAAAALDGADGAAWSRADTAAKALALAVAALTNASLRKKVSLGGGIGGIGGGRSSAPPHLHMTMRAERDLNMEINGKRGILREHMGGNRCDFSARGVIGTEAYDDIWRLGIPRFVMKTLTYPARVTATNLAYLAASVRRGAAHAFGAKTIIKASLLAAIVGDAAAAGVSRTRGMRASVSGAEGGGTIIALKTMSRADRRIAAAGLVPGDTVERTLREGDLNSFGRQPSLHKLAALGFHGAPTDGRTCPPDDDDASDDGLDSQGRPPPRNFRLHISVMAPFNADADGDEMNLHAPQSEMARAELATFMCVAENLVSSSGVRMGLVQDAVLGAYLLTARDTLLSREAVCSLLMHVRYDPHGETYRDAEMQGTAPRVVRCAACLDHANGALPQPAVLFRKQRGAPLQPLWTGKQLWSTLLPPQLELTKAVRSARDEPRTLEAWMGDDEAIVHVHKGVLVCGRLDADVVGAKRGGFVEEVATCCSSWAAAKWLSDANRVSHAALELEGLGRTVSMLDLIEGASTSAAAVRHEIDAALTKAAEIDALPLPMDVREEGGLALTRGILNKVGALAVRALPRGSALAEIAASGAKGSSTKVAEMMGVIGTQHVQYVGGGSGPLPWVRSLGRRRTLPTVSWGDGRPIARGFIAESLLGGLSPTSLFTYTMAARDGIVSTACGTAVSGYESRRRTTPSTNQTVAYDASVRDGGNGVVQQHYGGDDFDSARVQLVSVGAILAAAAAEGADAAAAAVWGGCAPGAAATAAGLRTLLEVRLHESAALSRPPPSADEWARTPFPVACNWQRALRMGAATAAAENGGGGAYAAARSTDFAAALRALLVEVHAIHAAAMAAGPAPPPPTVPLAALVSGDWQPHAPASAALRHVDDASRVARAVLAAQCVPAPDVSVRGLAHASAIFLEAHRAALVAPGEAVGVIGATSIAEPATQLSFVYETRITIQQGGRERSLPLGAFVDECIASAAGGGGRASALGSMAVSVPRRTSIRTVDAAGSVRRALVTGASRHPPAGDLLRVTTASGAVVTATLAKSFLVMDGGCIVPRAGADLRLGDIVPALAARDAPPPAAPTVTAAARAAPPRDNFSPAGALHPAVHLAPAPRAVPRAVPLEEDEVESLRSSAGELAVDAALAALPPDDAAHDDAHSRDFWGGTLDPTCACGDFDSLPPARRGRYARGALAGAFLQCSAAAAADVGEGVPTLRVVTCSLARAAAAAGIPPWATRCASATADGQTWLVQGSRAVRLVLAAVRAALTSDRAMPQLLPAGDARRGSAVRSLRIRLRATAPPTVEAMLRGADAILEAHAAADAGERRKAAALTSAATQQAVGDAIVGIERQAGAVAFVYDLTVADTLNFLVEPPCGAALFVRDTLNAFHTLGTKTTAEGGMTRLKQLTAKSDAARTANMTFVIPIHAGMSEGRARRVAERLARTLAYLPLRRIVAASTVLSAPPTRLEQLMADTVTVAYRSPALRVGEGATPAEVQAAAAAAAADAGGVATARPRFSMARSAVERALLAAAAVRAHEGNHRKRRRDDAASEELIACAPPRLAAHAIELTIAKDGADRASVSLDDVVRALRTVVRADALVTATPAWEGEWRVRIRLATLGAGPLDRSAAAGVLDALLNVASVRGIAPVSLALVARERRIARDAAGALHPLDAYVVRTNGSRFADAQALAASVDAGVALELSTTSNVPEVEASLGLEAALRVLAAEQHKVICGDGRYVDARHTALQTEMMGRAGSIVPLNAQSMVRLGASTILRASFERAILNLTSAALVGESDALGGPSERQIVGLSMLSGTGLPRTFAAPSAAAPSDAAPLSFVPPLAAAMRMGRADPAAAPAAVRVPSLAEATERDAAAVDDAGEDAVDDAVEDASDGGGRGARVVPSLADAEAAAADTGATDASREAAPAGGIARVHWSMRSALPRARGSADATAWARDVLFPALAAELRSGHGGDVSVWMTLALQSTQHAQAAEAALRAGGEWDAPAAPMREHISAFHDAAGAVLLSRTHPTAGPNGMLHTTLWRPCSSPLATGAVIADDPTHVFAQVYRRVPVTAATPHAHALSVSLRYVLVAATSQAGAAQATSCLQLAVALVNAYTNTSFVTAERDAERRVGPQRTLELHATLAMPHHLMVASAQEHALRQQALRIAEHYFVLRTWVAELHD